MQSAIDSENKDKTVSALFEVKDIEAFRKQYPECGIRSEIKTGESTTIFVLTCSYEIGEKIIADAKSNENIVTSFELEMTMFSPHWGKLYVMDEHVEIDESTRPIRQYK